MKNRALHFEHNVNFPKKSKTVMSLLLTPKYLSSGTILENPSAKLLRKVKKKTWFWAQKPPMSQTLA